MRSVKPATIRNPAATRKIKGLRRKPQPLNLLVPRDEIELPTHEFSDLFKLKIKSSIYNNLIPLVFSADFLVLFGVFIDENFATWPNQWAFLAQALRMDEAQLNGAIAKLIQGQDLGDSKKECCR